MDKEYAYFLLNKNKEDYNRIAQFFDETRNYIPSDFLYIKSFIRKDEKILDLGCGNGRLSELISSESYLGLDFSNKILEIARKKYPDKEFKQMDNPLKIPFDNNYFDTIFCLAVLHHIPSKDLREQYLLEINRVLKKQGKLILTVWDLNKDKKARTLMVKSLFSKIFKKSKLDLKDIFYPWKDSNENILVQRYVHIFSSEEFKKMIKKIGFEILEFKKIERSKNGSNIVAICKKHS